MRELHLIRGLPGSGKSTEAEALSQRRGGFPRVCYVESDMFFMGHDGVYRFNRFQREDAHKWCRQVAITAMENRTPTVIVSNVFCRLWSMEAYVRAAWAEGYLVQIHALPAPDLDTSHTRNLHAVPRAAIQRMSELYQDLPEEAAHIQPIPAEELHRYLWTSPKIPEPS